MCWRTWWARSRPPRSAGTSCAAQSRRLEMSGAPPKSKATHAIPSTCDPTSSRPDSTRPWPRPRAWPSRATTRTSSRRTCWRRCSRRPTARARCSSAPASTLGALRTALDTAHRLRCRRCRAGQQVQVGRDLVALLQAAEKEASKRGDQFIASEMFLLAAGRRQDRPGRHRPRPWPDAQGARGARSTRCAAAPRSTRPKPRASARR